jgi:hypothetical protein
LYLFYPYDNIQTELLSDYATKNYKFKPQVINNFFFSFYRLINSTFFILS